MYHSDLIDEDIAAALWRLLEGMANTSAPQDVREDQIIGYSSTANTDFNASNNTAFTPTSNTTLGAFTTQSTSLYPDDANAWGVLAQVFSDAGPVAPQLVGEPHRTGVSPNAASSAAATPNLVVSPSSSATPPGSQDELAWLFGPGQSHHLTSSFRSGGEGTLVAPELGTNIFGATTYPVGWATNDVAWRIPAVPEKSATMALGKRRRDESHDDRVPVVMNSREMSPQKRVRGSKANGILKTARSATRTRHKPGARIPQTKKIHEPKQPVRGAERLATPDSQGFHHQSLLGPSLQQGWAVEAADGQLIWVEGSVEEMAHTTNSAVQQQQKEETRREYFKIPKTLKTGCQGLLVATQADWARGVVREIKCRLCPDHKFKNWGKFKRHCEYMETHPLYIYDCKYCGTYFARRDSCKRHEKIRPDGCKPVTAEEAKEKREATKRAHDEFKGRLEGFLTTGEEDKGMSFSKTMKNKFPGSSKKHIRRRE